MTVWIAQFMFQVTCTHIGIFTKKKFTIFYKRMINLQYNLQNSVKYR